MGKVTAALSEGNGSVFICDFSPPRGTRPDLLDGARQLKSDFICVAYNPGKAVRVDSISAAFAVKNATGRDVIFNLSPRDMNRLAIESRLLGAELLGVQNVIVIQSDAFTDKDGLTAAGDYTTTGLITAIRDLNNGIDFRGSKLRNACDFCVGAAIDLGKGIEQEARLAHRKVEAGAEFFVTQPIFDVRQVAEFTAAYERAAGATLQQPVFWGLQILAEGGLIFSNVPDGPRRDLEAGRDGVEIALETYTQLQGVEVEGFYLIPPILKGGVRDYEAAGRFVQEAGAIARS